MLGHHNTYKCRGVAFDSRLRPLYENILSKTGSWIGYTAKFKGVPCFPHGLHGVFISGGASIGKNTVIFQHVTIGSNTLNGTKKQGSPNIGDNVYIGSGAKIIGNVNVGDNCRIGANAVIYNDIPPHSVAVLQPTKVVIKDKLDNRYFSMRNGKWFYYDNGIWVEDKNKCYLNNSLSEYD